AGGFRETGLFQQRIGDPLADHRAELEAVSRTAAEGEAARAEPAELEALFGLHVVEAGLGLGDAILFQIGDAMARIREDRVDLLRLRFAVAARIGRRAETVVADLQPRAHAVTRHPRRHQIEALRLADL